MLIAITSPVGIFNVSDVSLSLQTISILKLFQMTLSNDSINDFISDPITDPITDPISDLE